MKRVWIIGASGSAKTTLAQRLSERLNATFVDLDELNWRPNWNLAPEDEFLAALEEALKEERWVVAGNYSQTQARFLHLADTVVWLDYSLPVVLLRQLKRTFRRMAKHEACCNGNYESLRRTFSRDSVVLWLLRRFNHRRRSGWNTKQRARRERMRFMHFRHPAQCEFWLNSPHSSSSE